MTATAHSLVGASIVKLAPNPYLAIPLAFISNFLLDMIPHWDTGTGWRGRPRIFTFFATSLDVMIGLFLSFLVFRFQVSPFYLLAGIFAATLPDWLAAPYIFLAWDLPPFSWFYRFQSKIHARDGTVLGIVTQVVTVLPIVYLASQGLPL